MRCADCYCFMKVVTLQVIGRYVDLSGVYDTLADTLSPLEESFECFHAWQSPFLDTQSAPCAQRQSEACIVVEIYFRHRSYTDLLEKGSRAIRRAAQPLISAQSKALACPKVPQSTIFTTDFDKKMPKQVTTFDKPTSRPSTTWMQMSFCTQMVLL